MKKMIFTIVIIFITLGHISNAQTVQGSTYNKRLYYICKVWGFLKYFHSEVAKGTKNWDNALIQTLDLYSVKSIREDISNSEFNDLLGSMINSAGKMAQPNFQLLDVPDSLKYNLNLNWLNDPVFSDEIKARLDTVRDWFRPHANYYAFSIPTTNNPAFTTDSSFYGDISINGPSVNIRLLALFRYWNIINYFCPNKYLMDQNWDTTLTEFIPIILKASGSMPFFKALIKLASRLNDTHAYTGGPLYYDFYGSYYLPLRFKYVENQTIIIDVYDNSTGLKIGDVIKDINDVDINTIRDSIREYMYASNEAAINERIDGYLREGPEENVKLTIENNQGEKNITVARNIRYTDTGNFYYDSEPVWKIINKPDSKKYGYVNMGKLEVSQLDTMFNDLWNTDAIIFDLRNYPKGTLWSIVKYLFKAPIHIADFKVPDTRYPGTQYWLPSTIGTGDFSKTYDKNIFILVDENTISQAEYTAMGLQQYPNAVIIGNQTMGADGNVSLIYLPEGILSVFTGLGVFYPDHRQTQRIGIVPDVVVYPTIEGIRTGRDEVLEAALNYSPTGIENNLSNQLQISLLQNFPNPFNPSTVIKYSIPQGNNVKLVIYNILGQKVATLINKYQKAGII
ncbi:MAG: S41 family peptidase [Ignavibacteriaceae bacterium]